MSRDHRWKISFSIIVGCLFGAAIYYIYNGFVQEFRYHLYAGETTANSKCLSMLCENCHSTIDTYCN